MKRKTKHRVILYKTAVNSYSVIEFTYDRDGSTVNHHVHNEGLAYSEALAKKKEILACYS